MTMMGRRRGLVVLAIVGAVASLAMTTGMLAVFSDVARTGFGAPENRDHVETEDRLKEVDLQLASHERSVGCGAFVDDLLTPVFQADDVRSGTLYLSLYVGPDGRSVDAVCVRNAGEQPIDELVVATAAVAQLETGCTGSEGEVDPEGPACGTVGEAGDHVELNFEPIVCGAGISGALQPREPLIGFSRALPILADGVLDVGEVACYQPLLLYNPPSLTDEVAGQSDMVQFRFRFSAEVA
jgi:hypothetical protein